jgi:steroid 5-alpha reductase family enzyme
MMDFEAGPVLSTAWIGLEVVLAWALVLWVVSLRLKDSSIADPFWAPSFLVVGSAYWIAAGGAGVRGTVALALIALWAGRLGWHLWGRNRREGEDRRYGAMRDHRGASFWWVSLFTVFLLQAVLVWLVSMPLLAAVLSTNPFGPWDWLGILLALVGTVLEGSADAQLKRFKSDPDNDGAVMDRGLWRYSRHPNYFGNAVLWWGLYLLAVGGRGAWTGFAPILMTVLLLKVSGVSLLERDIENRRPGYRDYVRRTSAFIPWPPAR